MKTNVVSKADAATLRRAQANLDRAEERFDQRRAEYNEVLAELVTRYTFASVAGVIGTTRQAIHERLTYYGLVRTDSEASTG